ncbi:MAG TPA: hypothetical protein ENI85_13270 [Deltaproteobacteria bacterium]|nr:hypothetical protein [Deltaproteobacteria bacterium]
MDRGRQKGPGLLQPRRIGVWLGWIALLVSSGGPAPAAARGGEAPEAEPAADAALSPEQAVLVRKGAEPRGKAADLDSLLRLPNDFLGGQKVETVAGASRTEWHRRFVKAVSELTRAREALEKTKRELDGVAESGGSSQWSIAPPGGESAPTASPLSFKLRQQLRGDRERIEQAEKALRSLRIEADLAGVPESWRAKAAEPADSRPD